MFDLDYWQEIWMTITRNKTRSFLTGFGVFWGIFMLVVLLGTGTAMESGFMSTIKGFSPNTCFFFPGKTSEAYKGYRKGRSWYINNRDVQLIRQKATVVDLVSPMLYGGGSNKNVVRGNKSGTYGYRGVYPDHFKMESMNVLAGRVFNELDTELKRKVCVLGKEVYETLFDNENALGEYVRVNGIYFQVVGVVSPKSDVSVGGQSDKLVFLPFETVQKAFNVGDRVHFLSCTSKAGYPATVVEEQVKAIIREAHSISPTDDKALGSFNIEKQFMAFMNLFLGIRILVWVVGIGALLSGIIGISNIMMVTVRERTREIGVRRALGAKPRTILVQILNESFVLTTIAGFIGLFIGLLIMSGVESVIESMSPEMLTGPLVSFNMALVALFILIVSGILAGVMPAMRALKIKAIDAIREE